MTELSPKTVHEQLKKQTSSRVQSSLDAIFQVCTEQKERGLNEFGYSIIARLGKGRGVPAAQSIRNKTGEPYRTLIASFANSSLQPDKSTISLNKGKSFTWIEKLKDPVVRLQANILYSQKLAAEKLVKEIVPIDQVIEFYDGGSSSSPNLKLTDLEREALEYLISKEFMRRAGLEVGPNGSILSSNDKDNFLPVATLDAVKKALQYL
ncbi:hypothetical protein PSEHALCIP103_03372 [Pseudoalteromonas haloplanktis]|jgi:hypothetical protein|uniref:Uncharacterized protein n=3 Tax=root TaxID=1 RepID=A0A9W4R3H2_PSEHA|nr:MULTISPECIES: gamma-mobile-trio protein GmtX [Pseudoalteromonas]ADT69844.1 conserved hypothetical protein [Pseudoalteromonas sp. SM9913]MDN3436411.1 gamma-mobile-trio protein GmtX [Pseudoalteromonas sp. APC 3356]MDN3489694.1 gamma-mobile-trio protein GmtX [Pseudoalteromonas sp. APC 3694]TVU79921.1 hypothetical protein FQP85_21735 [Pseudoalteromonas neustonica]CAH9065405.1 hypothetical protein PSEHALCIP103_03372 [Pseudoalteromonas haloplanktis]|tara:strand:+ start:32644 stop:33267 length:624 start_codon:yes stop_codon:yes gene_type:complete